MLSTAIEIGDDYPRQLQPKAKRALKTRQVRDFPSFLCFGVAGFAFLARRI